MQAVSQTGDAFLFSITKLAEALGVTRDSVRKALADVEPQKQRNGYDVYHLRHAVTLKKEKYKPVENPEELPPKDRKDWYEGEFRRIELAKQKAQLLLVDDVRDTLAETFKQLALVLDTLVDVIERDVGLEPEQVVRIQEIIDAQRETLFNKLCSQAPNQ